MSRTEIYAIGQDGVASRIGDTHNAHRGAMAVWGHLAEKYIDSSIVPPYLRRYGVMSALSAMNDLKPLWALHKDPRLTSVECITLLSTFDNVIVEAAGVPRLIAAFREVAADIPNSSLIEQAEIIDAYVKANPTTQGIGWNQTSVNSDVFSGSENANGEWIDYNINDNPKHWFLFAELDARQTNEGEVR